MFLSHRRIADVLCTIVCVSVVPLLYYPLNRWFTEKTQFQGNAYLGDNADDWR